MSSLNRQFNELVLDILVLKLLRGRDMYSLQIIQAAEEKSEGYFRIKETSLYNVLNKLEENEIIGSYWKRDLQKNSVPRKYYRITEKGKDILEKKIIELEMLFKGIECILNLKSGPG